MLKKMKRAWMLGLVLLAIGCNPPSTDERLARFAQESMDQQSRQNETLARQSEAVVTESSRLADAAGNLVAKDAEARKHLIEAQRQLTSELHSERADRSSTTGQFLASLS